MSSWASKKKTPQERDWTLTSWRDRAEVRFTLRSKVRQHLKQSLFAAFSLMKNNQQGKIRLSLNVTQTVTKPRVTSSLCANSPYTSTGSPWNDITAVIAMWNSQRQFWFSCLKEVLTPFLEGNALPFQFAPVTWPGPIFTAGRRQPLTLVSNCQHLRFRLEYLTTPWPHTPLGS